MGLSDGISSAITGLKSTGRTAISSIMTVPRAGVNGAQYVVDTTCKIGNAGTAVFGSAVDTVEDTVNSLLK